MTENTETLGQTPSRRFGYFMTAVFKGTRNYDPWRDAREAGFDLTHVTNLGELADLLDIPEYMAGGADA